MIYKLLWFLNRCMFPSYIIAKKEVTRQHAPNTSAGEKDTKWQMKIRFVWSVNRVSQLSKRCADFISRKRRVVILVF